MNRRTFFGAILSLCAAWQLKAKPDADTDYDYVDVTMPIRAVIPYLDGCPVRGVQAASVSGGWVDIAVSNDHGRYLHDENGKVVTVRFFGVVQLLKSTPERSREFLATSSLQGSVL